jgi:hypothetical protein
VQKHLHVRSAWALHGGGNDKANLPDTSHYSGLTHRPEESRSCKHMMRSARNTCTKNGRKTLVSFRRFNDNHYGNILTYHVLLLMLIAFDAVGLDVVLTWDAFVAVTVTTASKPCFAEQI